MDEFKSRFLAALRKPVAAAALSFLFPGLGQAAAGDRHRGLIVSIPMFSIIGAFLVILIFDRSSLLGLAVNQQWLSSLLILDLVALIYHVWAIIDSYRVAGKAQPRRRRGTGPTSQWAAVAGICLILSGTVAIHGGVAKVDADWQHALYCITAQTPCWLSDNAGATGTLDFGGTNNGDDPIASDGSSPGPVVSTGPLSTFDLSALPSFQTTTNSANWAADGQLNVLIIGSDFEAGTTRAGLRPDTMIVVHVDLASGKVAMIGVPRNQVCVPLPQDIAKFYATSVNGCPAYTWGGHLSNGKPNIASAELNWLPKEAAEYPSHFPDYPQSMSLADQWTRGELATMDAVGTLLGFTPASGHPLDGYVIINLLGVSSLIDALGGIDITVPQQVYDRPCGNGPNSIWSQAGPWGKAWNCGEDHSGYAVPGPYSGVQEMYADAANPNANGRQIISWHGIYSAKDGKTSIAFTIKAGFQHMDGQWALAYARTRKFAAGADFGRMARQQLVIQAMRTTFQPCQLLPKVPGLLTQLGDTFSTNLPLSDASSWARLAQRILGPSLTKGMIVLNPGDYNESYLCNGVCTSTKPAYPAIDASSWGKIQDKMLHSLDNVAAATGGSGGGGGGFSC